MFSVLMRGSIPRERKGVIYTKYGRRIRNGNGGDVQWCELTDEEVEQVLKENVDLNAEIYSQCYQQALVRMNIATKEGQAALAMNPHLQRQVDEIALGLFEQSAVKAFVALQAALDATVHLAKVHAMG